MGDIALGREEKLYVRAATTQNTNVTAFVGGDVVFPIGDVQFTQQINLINNEEKRNSRTRLTPISERYPPGSYNFSLYLKPASGAGGKTEPEAAALWKAGYGTQTSKANTVVKVAVTSFPATVSKFYVTAHGTARTNTAIIVKKGTSPYWEVTWVVSMAATKTSGSKHRQIRVNPELGTAPINAVTVIGSVTYSLIATTPSAVGFLVDRGHSVFRYRGACVGQIVHNVGGTGLATADFSGQYMREYWTGSDELSAKLTKTGANSTKMTVKGSALRFMEGSFFKIDSEIIYVNGKPGTSNIVSNLLRAQKSSTAASHVTTAQNLITPWSPTTTVGSVGNITPGYRGYIQINSTNLLVLNSQTTLNNGIKMAEGEKNNTKYVQSFSTPGFREVTGQLTCYFRKANLEHFRIADEQLSRQFVIPIGDPADGAGKQVSIQLAQVKFETPGMSGNEEVNEDLNFRAFGSSSSDNDELRIAFL